MRLFDDETIKKYLSSEVSVFCGAGVSVNSGLPSANAFLQNIFHEIKADDAIAAQIIRRLPFESIVELMIRYTDTADFLSMFSQPEIKPNFNHIFLTKLRQSNYIQHIYTVNFDLLFEEAAKINRFELSSDYKDGDLISLKSELIKLHGSAGDIASMKVTLESIANKTALLNLNKTVEAIFNSKRESTIIILGYSCSDYFDIVPAISSIVSPKTKILFIQHALSGCTVKDIRDVEFLDEKTKKINPFTAFDGLYIEMNTDKFIDEWNGKTVNIGRTECDVKFDWQKSLQPVCDLLKGVQNKFLGTLCNMTGDYKESLNQYYLAEKNGDREDLPFVYHQLVLLNYIMGNEQEKKIYAKKIKDYLQTADDKVCEANMLEIEAEENIKNMKYDAAIDCYKKCQQLRKKMQQNEGVVNAIYGIGNVYYIKKDLKSAYFYTKKALDEMAALNITNLTLDSNIRNNLAILLSLQNKNEEAIHMLSQVIEIKKKLYDVHSLFDAYLSLGTIYKNSKEFSLSLNQYTEAKNIAEQNELLEHIPKINYQLGVYYLQCPEHNIQKAEDYLEKALAGFKARESISEIAICSELLDNIKKYA